MQTLHIHHGILHYVLQGSGRPIVLYWRRMHAVLVRVVSCYSKYGILYEVANTPDASCISYSCCTKQKLAGSLYTYRQYILCLCTQEWSLQILILQI